MLVVFNVQFQTDEMCMQLGQEDAASLFKVRPALEQVESSSPVQYSLFGCFEGRRPPTPPTTWLRWGRGRLTAAPLPPPAGGKGTMRVTHRAPIPPTTGGEGVGEGRGWGFRGGGAG